MPLKPISPQHTRVRPQQSGWMNYWPLYLVGLLAVTGLAATYFFVVYTVCSFFLLKKFGFARKWYVYVLPIPCFIITMSAYEYVMHYHMFISKFFDDKTSNDLYFFVMVTAVYSDFAISSSVILLVMKKFLRLTCLDIVKISVCVMLFEPVFLVLAFLTIAYICA